MLYLYFFALVLHVACAAAWFGLSLRLPGLSRLIVDSDATVGKVLSASGATTVRMMDLFALLLYAFAFLVIIAGPGFAGLGWNFHIALSLGLVLILIQAFLIRRSWSALRSAVGGDELESSRKKVAMSLGVGHLIWFVLLVLMFLPRVMVV